MSAPGVGAPGQRPPGERTTRVDPSSDARAGGARRGRVPDVEIFADDEETSYTAPGDVLFDFDEAELRSDAIPTLQQVGESIEERFPDSELRVDGHTDSVGTDDYNQELSEQRAQAVADWLSSEGGTDAGRITVTGYGATAPVAPNEAPDA